MRCRTMVISLMITLLFLNLSNLSSQISVYAEEHEQSQIDSSTQLGNPVECASNNALLNNKSESGMVIWRYQDDLFFIIQEESATSINKQRAGIIYKIHEGQVMEVHSLRQYFTNPLRPKPRILCILDKFVYFYSERVDAHNSLFCYNMDTDTETVLVEDYIDYLSLRYLHFYVSPDETIHYPILNRDTREWEELLIQGDQVLGIQEGENHYIDLDQFSYYTVVKPIDPDLPVFEADWLVQVNDTNGEKRENFIVNGQSIEVQCDGIYKTKAGLLVESASFIDDLHTRWSLLSSQGEFVPVFPMAELDPTIYYLYDVSYAVLEDKIYVSMFWKDSYNLSPELKEKIHREEIEGTYCIDLFDLSVSKISDQTFEGMFVIDDKGIFCTKGVTISILDWKGSIIMAFDVQPPQ